MLHHCKVVLFGLFIATFTAAVASATTYTITSLLPAGDTTSEAIGIDQSGDVVGSCTTAAGKIDGMLYTGGVAMDMGMVPVWSPPSGAGGGIISVASTVFNSVAVSASTGDLLIAGTVQYNWSLGPPYNYIPFILDYNPTSHAKTWTIMPSQYNGGPGNYSYNNGAGWGINANGQFIGSNDNASQMIQPFTSLLAGTQTNIANIPPMLSNGTVGASTFWGIDSAGDAAGRAPTTASGTGGDDLVLYLAGGSVVDFGSPNTGGIDCGIYRSGNNIYVTGEEFNPTQEAVWTYNTVTSTYTVNGLGVLGQAYGINGSLTEIGLNGIVYNATTSHTQALIYSNSTVPGIVGSSWANSSYFPRGINDAGAIAGYGTYNGATTAFLLTPVPTPEPSSLALAAAGAFGLLAYAWRRRK